MNTTIATWVCTLGIASGLLGGFTYAQTAPDQSKSSKARISLLAIGDRPEITLTTTTQGSFYNKPPESEAPPDQLFVKEKKEFKMFMLGLNTPMDSVSHPGDTELKLYEKKSEAEDSSKEPYLSIPLPKEKVDLTVFLLRNPSTSNWRAKPLAIPFKNDLQSFPMDATRVINFSSAPIKVKLGEAVFDLGAKQSRIVPYPTASKGILEYKLGTMIKGEALIIADTAKSYYPGTRTNLIVYDADGKHRRQPVEHVVFLERPQEPVPLPNQVPAEAANTDATR